MVKSYASGDRITLGLSTMRDIILYRPKHSAQCLQTLLQYTTDGDGEYGREVSGPAIRCVVNKLYARASLKPIIEQFAIEHFEELQRTPQYFDPRVPQPPNRELQLKDAKQYEAQLNLYQESKQKWQHFEVQELKKFLTNHSQLFFALCTQKPELLSTLIALYIKCRPNVQMAVNQQMESLIKFFGNTDNPMIGLIASCPAGSELFVEHVARILTDNGKEAPSTELYNALIVCYFREPSDGGGQVRIFLPIVTHLDEDMVNKLLPALLGQLDKDHCKEAVGLVLKRTPEPVISPSRLLVSIQKFAPIETSPHIEKVIALTNYCLGQGAYDKQTLSAVLQQLVQEDPIPVLFMRTLIQTLLVYPDLTKFAMNVLEILIFRNEIWKNKHLWDGFIRCCHMTQPESYAVLCKLARSELQSVLQQKPELRAPLLEFALDSSVRPYVLEVLKEDGNKTKSEDTIAVKTELSQSQNLPTQQNDNIGKKRSRTDFVKGSENENEHENEHETTAPMANSNKRIKLDPASMDAPADDDNEQTTQIKAEESSKSSAYRVQFFLNKFVLQNYKNEALFKMENFLRHNFANLLKIEPSNIIGVKCHRQIPANIRLPDDTVICEVIFFNRAVNNRSMLEIVTEFKTHLQSMDFSSWKIFVGSQYVTMQELTHQQLLVLIKQLNITLDIDGNLQNIAEILKLPEHKEKETEKEKEKKKRKHKQKHKHRSRKHKSERKRSEKQENEDNTDEHEDDDSEEDDESSGTESKESAKERDEDGSDNSNDEEEEDTDDRDDTDDDDDDDDDDDAYALQLRLKSELMATSAPPRPRPR